MRNFFIVFLVLLLATTFPRTEASRRSDKGPIKPFAMDAWGIDGGAPPSVKENKPTEEKKVKDVKRVPKKTDPGKTGWFSGMNQGERPQWKNVDDIMMGLE
ncbi:hypothetical protein ACA910_021964 [Epithemia clementina (nom. ined.)]